MTHLWDVLRASYDRSAPTYDQDFKALQEVKYDALLSGRSRLGAALSVAPALDLGCGTGLLAEHLRRRGHEAQVVGVDLSPGMLRSAQGRLALAIEGEAAALPFAAASFGVVAAVTVLRILDTPVAPVLLEIDRVLRPGGLCLVSVLKARDDGSLGDWFARAGYEVEGPREAGQDVAWVARKPEAVG